MVPAEQGRALVVVDRHAHAGELRQVVDRRGRARSSRSRAAPTATPSRNTTFSRQTSLWHTIGPPAGSAISSFHVNPGRLGSNAAAARWKRAMSSATDANASSVNAQLG